MQPVDLQTLSTLLGRGPMAAWAAGDQNQRAQTTDDLANQLTLQNIASKQLENQVTQGALPDLIAKQRYINDQMGAITRSTNLGADEKQAQLQARQGIPGFYNTQAKQDLQNIRLDTANKSQKVLPALALMSSEPVGFLNAASMAGVSPEDAEGFASGYKPMVYGNWRNYVVQKMKENASTEPAVMGHQITAENQRTIAGMNIASREREDQLNRENRIQLEILKRQLATDVDNRVKMAKSFSEQKVIYTAAAAQAQAQGDTESAARYTNLANAIEPEVAREKAAAGAATVNPSAVGGGVLVPKGQAAQLPGNAPPTVGAPTPPQSSGQRVRVKGPAGEIGTIPIEQLQQALQQGYTQVQ